MDEERKIGQTLSTTFLRHRTTEQPSTTSSYFFLSCQGCKKKDSKNKGFGKTTGIREESRLLSPWPRCFPAFSCYFGVEVGPMNNPLKFSWKILTQTFNTLGSGAETFCRYLLHGLHFGICETGRGSYYGSSHPSKPPRLCCKLRLVRDPAERPTVADALSHSFVEEQESSQGEDDAEAGWMEGWDFGKAKPLI